MSTLTTGRAMAFERLLKEDAIMLPQYRKIGGRGIVLAKAFNRPFDFVRNDVAYSKTLDFLPSIKWNAKLLEVGGATIVEDGALVSAGVTSIVSKDADAVTLDTYAIPAAVQALTGYGWSAGEAYNYVDFERKVYVQRVASVDMGTLAWSIGQGWGTAGFFSNGLRSLGAKYPATNADTGNFLCAAYATTSRDGVVDTSEDKVLGVSSTGTLALRDTQYSTKTDLTAALSGVMLQYELATPVETDISAYLTDDNTMPVESGGSLTFENTNQIPVTSKIEYQRRLA